MFPNQTHLPQQFTWPILSALPSPPYFTLCWQNSLILSLHLWLPPPFLLSIIHQQAAGFCISNCAHAYFSFLEWNFLKIAKPCNIASYYIYLGFKSCFCLLFIPFIKGQNILFYFCLFLGLHPWHMEIPRLGVKLELQLLACPTATWVLSSICDLHHSSQQHRIPNHWARLGIEPTSSCILVGFVSREPQPKLPKGRTF